MQEEQEGATEEDNQEGESEAESKSYPEIEMQTEWPRASVGTWAPCEHLSPGRQAVRLWALSC